MCFICGMENPVGLKSQFYNMEDGSALTLFTYLPAHQSFPQRVHGGLIATMLDEATIADNTGDKTLDFVKTGTTGGTFAYHYSEESYYSGTITYSISGNWEIAEGQLLLSDVTYACDDEDTEISAPYGEAFKNYDFKCFRFTYEVDYDTSNDYVYLK